jgi:hypothetical protein
LSGRCDPSILWYCAGRGFPVVKQPECPEGCKIGDVGGRDHCVSG